MKASFQHLGAGCSRPKCIERNPSQRGHSLHRSSHISLFALVSQIWEQYEWWRCEGQHLGQRKGSGCADVEWLEEHLGTDGGS